MTDYTSPEAKKHFDWEMYRYVPNLAGAIVCIIIFSILAALHAWQWVKTRKNIILWVVLGAICESHCSVASLGQQLLSETLMANTYMRQAK
jgi:hypothetical protein